MKKLSELSETNILLKIIIEIIKIFSLMLIFAFILTVYLQKLSKNELPFFNYRMFTVISGSMEPKYNIGDVLFAKEVSPEEIKVGDAISYRGLVGTFKDKIITHEVVKINQDESGKYYFNTKGLTNLIEDPIVYEDQLFGAIKYKSPILSLIYKIINTNIGFFLCIIIPIVGIIGYELLSTLLAKEDKRRERKQ
ncbi:MAG: signal peptidase I [Bacilli bacterium]|nr:signal peptidase I [Bacilli bacterium]